MTGLKSERLQLAKIASREADKQRLFLLATSPVVLSTLTLFGGLLAANKIKWSEDASLQSGMRELACAGAVLTALSCAGVKDKWVLLPAAAAAGIAAGDGGGTSYSPLQAAEATGVGAGVGLILGPPGAVAGGVIGLGVDTIYQMVR